MPDITKCSGKGCNIKRSCYRYTAPSNNYQSYFVTPPIEENGSCKHYITVSIKRKAK